jgi:UDP-N-acetyl-D-glucosamine dehydrogenase
VTRRAPNADLTAFLNRIESSEAVVGVVGLGYVGLPVALSFAEAGFRVHGVDVDASRIQSLEMGESYLGDVAPEQIVDLMKASRFSVGSDYSPLAEADAILISVPTPLLEGAPDLSRVVASGKSLAAVLKPNSLVVLESTTYPGTTQELLAPLLEEGGMTAGEDFYLAFSTTSRRSSGA